MAKEMGVLNVVIGAALNFSIDKEKLFRYDFTVSPPFFFIDLGSVR